MTSVQTYVGNNYVFIEDENIFYLISSGSRSKYSYTELKV